MDHGQEDILGELSFLHHINLSPLNIRVTYPHLLHSSAVRVNVGSEKIEYFPNKIAADKPVEASGTIDLVNLKSVKQFDSLTFQLDGGSDGVYLLRADSKTEIACWINGLDSYLKEKLVRERE